MDSHVPTMNWSDPDLGEAVSVFKQNMCLYIEHEEIEDEAKQAMTIRRGIGDEGLKRLNVCGLSEADQEKPEHLWNFFEGQLKLNVNFRMHRVHLMQYRQKHDENIDDFVTRARTLALKCQFTDEELNERLIELIIASTPHDALRNDLYNKPPGYSVADVLQEGRKYEALSAGNEQLNQLGLSTSETVHAIDRGPACQNCGTSHKPRQCPADHDECNTCGLKGHWASCCRGNRQQKPDSNPSAQTQIKEEPEQHRVKPEEEEQSVKPEEEEQSVKPEEEEQSVKPEEEEQSVKPEEEEQSVKPEEEEQSLKPEEEQLPVCFRSVPEFITVLVKSEEPSLIQQRQTEHREEAQGQTEHSSHTDWEPPSAPTARSTALFPKYKSAPETSASVNEEEKEHQCHLCQKRFGTKLILRRHIRVHTGERPFSCSVCTKTFTRKGNLTKHMRVHRERKSYSCSTCNETFTREASLKAHVITHSEKKHRCSVCEMSFMYEYELERHTRVHRQYSCSICLKTYTLEYHLNGHMRKHTGETSCSICEKSFVMKDALKRHMQTHKITTGSSSCRLILPKPEN